MRNLYKNLPQSPGVYLMKNRKGEIIYIGKAGNLKKRASSYFLRPQDGRIFKLVGEIAKIDYKKTDTVLEALILEANLIKKYSPKYNIKDKDDKSFFYIEFTLDEFPRVILTRGKNITWMSHVQVNKSKEVYFGPYTSASSARQALRILRKIFPYSLHKFTGFTGSRTSGNLKKPCFDYEIGLCPGTCAGLISKEEYGKNIRNLKLFMRGKKKEIIKILNKEMKQVAKNLEFEKAEKLRRQVFVLKHIEDSALIENSSISKFPPAFDFAKGDVGRGKIQNSKFRIEGYDISNISGTSAVGSMVVFTNGAPDKNEYRKFKIRTVLKSDDVGMLREVLERRFSRHADEWPLPNLILVDGGEGQMNAAKAVLKSQELKIPVIGIVKGLERKKNEFHGAIPKWINTETLIKLRDEAHRFAISYHKKLRKKEFLL